MNRIRGLAFTSTVAVLLLSGARARANTLTLEECMAEAAKQNPDIAVAVAGVKSNEALLLGSYSNFLPQLSASANYTETSTNGGVPTTNASTGVTTIQAISTSQTQYAESLSANQSLFNGFTDMGKVSQAKHNLEAAKAALAIAKATVSSNIKTAFAELLFEQKSVDLTEQILKRQSANLRMVTLRYEGGNEHRGNQLYQVASVTQAQYQLDHAKRQVRNGARQLASLLGQPQTGELRVTGELIAVAPAVLPDFQTLATTNPNHVQAIENERAADANVTINNGSWYPNLNAIGSVGKTGDTWPPGLNRWSVGLVFTFPFFAGTSTISAVENAYALKHQAEYQTASTDYKLIATLEQAYAGLLDSIGQVKVADDFYKGAKARSVIADGKYNTGLMAFEDWTVIDADYTTRQQNLLLNQRNAMQAEATWENAEGVGAIK